MTQQQADQYGALVGGLVAAGFFIAVIGFGPVLAPAGLALLLGESLL